MLKKIKILPIASESLGVRSMCTLVETPDISILLDAGISLCPYRFNLMPHPLEYQAIAELRKRIQEVAKKVKIITISHYHYDHFTPSDEDWILNWTEAEISAQRVYGGKRLLVKSPFDYITRNQKKRAKKFNKLSNKFESIEIADDKTFIFGKDTKLKFSKAVSHGPEDNSLGWVIMLFVKFKNEKFIFAPDVQGPMSDNTLNQILSYNPQLILIGGPPLYLSKHIVDDLKINSGIKNMEKIVRKIPLTIIEHHILRDKNWRDKSKRLFREAKRNGNKIITAAEFLSKENKLYEANREELYLKIPPSKKFRNWVDKVLIKKKIHKPPLL